MASHRFYGEVERVYTHTAGGYIRLENATSHPPNQPFPEHGYFHLEKSHPNYDALYSLVLLASSGRHRLQIRTKADAVATAIAKVDYVVLDW